MARPAGVRNQDFEQKKQALTDKLLAFVLSDGVERPSFRQLAIAAETSEPTLRHYFTDRTGLIIHLMEQITERSEPLREALSQPQDSLDDAVLGYFRQMAVLTKTDAYVRVHAFAIREAMGDEGIQKFYLKKFLSAGIDAVAERIVRSKNGLATFDEARHAATLIVSTSLLRVVHQEVLKGKVHQPLDEEAYFERVGKWLLDGLRPSKGPSGK
ncbi:TetR/AcrR family transcriptional regulator [Henriciella barbarensis]|uniref:TetR/AcrR family transcriptional regulator n=1 Tax=Henriciella barbarensis TaxID=86342 RepID=A0A399QYZ8_9PROT|nr:TetR/AcrR family transcriptional regulator [Henriciella barbarensis]RIJ24356.1 TetR/AcrR family transcriptional regulator [Henriciella barbarensis]